ncbi:MAG: hypothetical protein ACLUTO_01080 [Anaerostipes sp.]
MKTTLLLGPRSAYSFGCSCSTGASSLTTASCLAVFSTVEAATFSLLSLLLLEQLLFSLLSLLLLEQLLFSPLSSLLLEQLQFFHPYSLLLKQQLFLYPYSLLLKQQLFRSSFCIRFCLTSCSGFSAHIGLPSAT